MKKVRLVLALALLLGLGLAVSATLVSCGDDGGGTPMKITIENGTNGTITKIRISKMTSTPDANGITSTITYTNLHEQNITIPQNGSGVISFRNNSANESFSGRITYWWSADISINTSNRTIRDGGVYRLGNN